MPFRRPFRKRQSMSIIQSEKNVFDITSSIGTGTNLQTIAIAVNAADNTVNNQVTRRCKIYRIWVELWAYGILASGVNNPFNWYIIKNPGANLTHPEPLYTVRPMRKNSFSALEKGYLVDSTMALRLISPLEDGLKSRRYTNAWEQTTPYK